MKKQGNFWGQRESVTKEVKSIVRDLGVDLVGIADLSTLGDMPRGIRMDSASFPYAIVMGAQMGKVGKAASGAEVSLFLERAAVTLTSILFQRGYHGLTVHPEDEFDPDKRIGLMSLKVLAKGAGLGWQGRSLLVVSPTYGPIHRLICVLTNMNLHPDKPVPNQCGQCSTCVDRCPTGALTFAPFEDHPRSREEVLNIDLCLGDNGCDVCLDTCPWREEHMPEVADTESMDPMTIGKNDARANPSKKLNCDT
jgi:epoxyqueuosine reductase QueG